MPDGRRRLMAAVTSALDTKTDKPIEFKGLMGAYVGGFETMNVAERPDFVYVRLRGATGEVIQAFNDNVAEVWDLPVIVARDPKNPHLWRITGRDIGQYGDWGGVSYLPPHASTHTFIGAEGYGSDPVWIAKRQWLPFLPSPNASGTQAIYIEQDYWYWEGRFRFWPGSGTDDILQYRPTGGGAGRFVTVYMRGDEGIPDYLVGPEYSLIYPPTDPTDFILAPDPDIGIPICAISLQTGTQNIGWNEIYDLRLAPSAYPQTGSDIHLYQDGVSLGQIDSLDFSGEVDVAVSGSFGYVFITGGGGFPLGGSTGTTTYMLVGVPEPVDSITGQYWRTPTGRGYATGSLNAFIDGISQVKDLAFEEHMAESGTFRYIEVPPTGTLHEVKFGVPVAAVGQVGPQGPTGSAGPTGPPGPSGDPGTMGIVALDEGIILGTGIYVDFEGENVEASISGIHVRVFVTGGQGGGGIFTGTIILLDGISELGEVQAISAQAGIEAHITGSIGYLTATGIQGPAGPQGPEGATGSQGPVGPQGATGSAGPQGAEGATGSQGVPGATGSVGPAGPEGATGSAGPQGPEGATGSVGPEGPQGATGSAGPQGIEGATGSVGPQGPEGPTGSVGPQGTQGIEGATGSQGIQGIQGPTGSAGPQGIEGATGSVGPTGPEGATGATGPAGPEGATGAVGPQGLEGATGATGPQGAEGATGATGPQGDEGATGSIGPAGPGVNGAIWRYRTDTGDADPGNGRFRFNDSTISSATAMYIDDLTDDGGNVENFLLLFGAEGNRVFVQNNSDSSKWWLFDLLADADDLSGYVRLPDITIIDFGVGTLSQNDRSFLGFATPGEQGPSGSPGSPGAEGATGATGPQGAEGATGATGPQGAEGATGATGPQGAEGATGSVGPAGAEGATGSTGPQGPEGATGSAGPQGAEGATGSTGPQGAEGATGATGPAGAPGASVRAGQAVPLGARTETFWKIPEGQYTTGSLSTAVNGVWQTPVDDYTEQFAVSGTFEFVEANPTGTIVSAIWGAPA